MWSLLEKFLRTTSYYYYESSTYPSFVFLIRDFGLHLFSTLPSIKVQVCLVRRKEERLIRVPKLRGVKFLNMYNSQVDDTSGNIRNKW